jgi:hypothetical protein
LAIPSSQSRLVPGSKEYDCLKAQPFVLVQPAGVAYPSWGLLSLQFLNHSDHKCVSKGVLFSTAMLWEEAQVFDTSAFFQRPFGFPALSAFVYKCAQFLCRFCTRNFR